MHSVHPSLLQLDHRPWPVPDRPWIWRQSWLDLVFIHYRVEPARLRPLLPDGLVLEEFDGSAWLGVVPFLMADVMARGLPAVPGISKFPELNVRTYVERDGKSGVWFFSLDAASIPFVFGGRALYGLPYHHARMRLRAGDGAWAFESRRLPRGPTFRAEAAIHGQAALPAPNSFEHWAAERYCLYSVGPGRRLLRLEIHHPPWRLQPVDLRIERDDFPAATGLQPLDHPPRCHFSPGVQVVGWHSRKL